METSKNDPAAFMVTCEQCGSWPMAYQTEENHGSRVRFACPRCGAHVDLGAKRPTARYGIDALAG